MTKKIRVGVLFGGKSAEHEVSLLSARTVIEAMDKEKYEPVLIGIGKNGEWFLHDAEKYLVNAHDPKQIKLGSSKDDIALVPKEDGRQLVSLSRTNTPEALDVIFPVLHGTYGEDGTVQGLLKLAGIPFVGAGVLGSAVGMDKDVMKRLLKEADLPIPKFMTLQDFERDKIDFQGVVKKLGLPLFVKPANLGSSVGVSKVKDEASFKKALDLAFTYDHKILLEEFIDGRELECSIIGNEHPLVSLPAEVIHGHEFYSYEAKYIDKETEFKIPADLPKELVKKVQDFCAKAYRALCCEGMARIDLFIKEDGSVFLNEINTIPGCTKTSMFPKQWAASGIAFPEIVDKLITFAFQRFEKEKKLKTTF